MSILEKFKAIIRQEEETQKAAQGTVVVRPVLNGAEWAAWAADAGVPAPVAAADLHVTIIYSANVVQMIPDGCPIVIDAKTGRFALMGPDEDAFALVFSNWQLQDRFWQYQDNGAVSSYPSYRPHMSLSYAAAGFELAPEDLAEAPEYIILGGEIPGAIGQTADDTDPEGDGDGAGDLIIVVAVEASAAKALGRDDLSPVDRVGFYDVAKGRPVTQAVFKRLGALDAEVAKAATRKPGAPVTKKSKDVTLKMTPKMLEVVKSAPVIGTDDEAHLLYTIANVYTIKGAPVEDLDGEGFTTRAMEEFIADVLKRPKSSTWEHEGDPVNTVVQGLVLSDEVQKALGIDLGFECLITATHFPDEGQWAKAKQGPWEQSIAGRFWYDDDGSGA